MPIIDDLLTLSNLLRDGVGGTVKRLAARASLQSHEITTPHQLYEWVQANITAIVFQYCSQDDYARMEIFLKDRFEKSCTITGTQTLHCFIPLSRSPVQTKAFSFSQASKEEKVCTDREQLSLREISSYVVCAYDNQWWVAYTLETQDDTEEVTSSFLHAHGPSRSFKYRSRPDVFTVSCSDVPA